MRKDILLLICFLFLLSPLNSFSQKRTKKDSTSIKILQLKEELRNYFDTLTSESKNVKEMIDLGKENLNRQSEKTSKLKNEQKKLLRSIDSLAKATKDEDKQLRDIIDIVNSYAKEIINSIIGIAVILFTVLAILIALKVVKGIKNKISDEVCKKIDDEAIKEIIQKEGEKKVKEIINEAEIILGRLKEEHKILYELRKDLININTMEIDNFSPEDKKKVRDYSERISQYKDEKYYNENDWYWKAIEEFDNKEYEKAINYFTKAIELKKDFIDAYNNRGNSYKKKGDYDNALLNYTKAIEYSRNFAKGYYNRGNVYDDIREYDKAIDEYTKAIRLNPNDVDSYTNRGVAYYHNGDYEKAIRDYLSAIEIKSDDIISHKNLSEALLVTGEYGKGFEYIQKVNTLKMEDKDEAYLKYLECIIIKVLGKDTQLVDLEYDKILKRNFYISGSLDMLEKWLSEIELTNDIKRYIQHKTELLKKKKETKK